MSKSKDELFCFFSGFAQRDVEIIQYDKDLDLEIVILTCQNHGKHKLSTGNYIQLDGVLFELIETNNSYFKACSTFEMIKNTSIEGVSPGNKLSLGILAENDLSHECLWMLQPSALGQITYKNYSQLEEHQHTLKLDFEAPIEFSTVIQPDHHLGLAGSSLTAKEISHENNWIKFSIYCGRETRENTQFNQNLKPETQVNITESAAIEDRTCKLN
ncbi:MAG: hypothetical protein H0T84_11135 [Tatlockia sp.]|nr:hypothetical protein [Tatlockia sp.]